MDEVRGRSPTLRDALILVAATAVGLGLVRMSGLRLNGTTFREKPLLIFLASQAPAVISLWIAPFLAAWSMGTLLMGWLAPDSSAVRRGPGWIGAASVSLLVVIEGVWAVACRWPAPGSGHSMVVDVVRGWHQVGFCAVAASWLSLRLAGAWSPSPAWVDRSGRWLGRAWLVTGAVHYASSFAYAVLHWAFGLI